MQKNRKDVCGLRLAQPLSTPQGRLGRLLFFIACCWLSATVDGVGEGGAVDMQCTDYSLTTPDYPPPWPKPGQANVWSSLDGVTFEFNSGCGIKLKNPPDSTQNVVTWNATVPTGKGYKLTLVFDGDSVREAVRANQEINAGIRWHEVGDTKSNFTYITSKLQLAGGACDYVTYAYQQKCYPSGVPYSQGDPAHESSTMVPKAYCEHLFTQDASLPQEMTVYVTPEGFVTHQVKLQGGRELMRTYDYTSVVKGAPPARVGVEIMQTVDMEFTSFSASFWEPEAMANTTMPLEGCIDRNAKGLLIKYFIGLAVVTAIVAVHIVLAYRLVRRNYWHDNKPHVLNLFCMGIAGLDSFGDIAQAGFFYLAWKAARWDDPTSNETHTLWIYLLVSLILVVGNILYNAVILLYVIGTSGGHMNQKLLMQHRIFFALQAALTVTNLELLPLFPWRYEAFQVTDSEDIKDLEGFPSTRLMVLSVLPVVFVDLPMIVLQALTQQLNNDFGTILLICMQALGSLDVICRFFTRAFITASEVESRRRSRKMFNSPATIGHITVSTDTSVAGPGSVLSGRDSISPMTTVWGRDMEHLELGPRPDSAPTTFDPNDVGFFASRRHPHMLRKVASCRI